MLPPRPKYINNSSIQKKGQTAKPFSILSLGLLGYQNKSNQKGKHLNNKKYNA